MNIITLDSHDVVDVKRIARQRIINNIGCGANYTPYFDGQRFEHEFESFGAEFAFCKMMGVKPDMDPTHFMAYDAIVSTDRVDVKWTRLINGCLQAKVDKDWYNPPDYFALMIGRLPTYSFCGYMKASELLRPERIDRRRQKTPVYSARQDELYMDIFDA